MSVVLSLFIEYDSSSVPFQNRRNVRAFARGPFFIPQDYKLYNALAGICDESGKYMYPPRGLPLDLSWDLIPILFYAVRDKPGEFMCDEKCLDRKEAELAVNQGLSYYIDSGTKQDGFVFDWDYKRPSWLYRDELIGALSYAEISDDVLPSEFRIIIKVLELLEMEFGFRTARIVFLFDY